MAKNSRYVGSRLATTVNARYYPDEKVIDAYYLDGRFTSEEESRAANWTYDREERGFLFALFAYPAGEGKNPAEASFARNVKKLNYEVKEGEETIDTQINDLADLAIEVGGRATLPQNGARQSYFSGVIVKEGEIAAVTTAAGCAFLYRGNVLYPLTTGDFELEAIDLNGNPVQHLFDYSAGVAGTIRYSNLAQIQEDDCLILCNKEVLDILGQREMLRILSEAESQEDAASTLITSATAKQAGVSLQLMLSVVDYVDYVEPNPREEEIVAPPPSAPVYTQGPATVPRGEAGTPPYRAQSAQDGGYEPTYQQETQASGRPPYSPSEEALLRSDTIRYDHRATTAGADYVASDAPEDFPAYDSSYQGYEPGYNEDYGYGDEPYDQQYEDDAYSDAYASPAERGYADDYATDYDYEQDYPQDYGYDQGLDPYGGEYYDDSYYDSQYDSHYADDPYYDEYQDSYYDEYQQNYYDDYDEYYEDPKRDQDKVKRVVFYVVLLAIIAVCVYILIRLLGGDGKEQKTSIESSSSETSIETSVEESSKSTTAARTTKETAEDEEEEESSEEESSEPAEETTESRSSGDGETYTVKYGDSFYGIMISYYGSFEQSIIDIVLNANPQIQNIDNLVEGMEIILPPLD